MNKVSEIPNHMQYKQNGQIDNEMILFVCNCVEELVFKKYQIDKKSLVIDICRCLFALADPEMKLLEITIQFLFDNKMIKKIPIVRKIKKMVINYLKSKVSTLL